MRIQVRRAMTCRQLATMVIEFVALQVCDLYSGGGFAPKVGRLADFWFKCDFGTKSRLDAKLEHALNQATEIVTQNLAQCLNGAKESKAKKAHSFGASENLEYKELTKEATAI